MEPKPRYQPGDKIGGQYLVHQVLMGGMGEVYLCLDLKTTRPFALKTFQAQYLANPNIRELFHREIAAWVALEKHPNIVRCHFMEILDNQPFMFLEWIAGDEYRGNDLRSWLRHGPLDLRLALDFTIDICRGMIHAQQKQPGIVHRDLKPDNILVTQDRVAKISDFGLVKIAKEADLEMIDSGSKTDGRQSLQGQNGIVGTPPYMAPEQWRGEALDSRTDIYAVGCILYEMLTGCRPFQATSNEDLRRQHLEVKVPTLINTQINPDIHNRLIPRCLAKHRDERFRNTDDFLSQLITIYRGQFNQSPKSINLNQPFNYVDYTNRGVTYFSLKRYNESLIDFNEALKMSPDSPLIYSNRGLVLNELHRFDEAIADFMKALWLDPGFAMAYSNLGNVYDNMGNYEDAIKNYSRAIELDPDMTAAYVGRGTTFDKLKRFDEALLDHEKAMCLDPINVKCYVNRGLNYSKQGRYQEALKDFNEAIRLEPLIAQTFSERGVAYLNLELLDEALDDFDRAIELDPSFSLAYANRGIVFHKRKMYENAMADLTMAIRIDPTNTFALLRRSHTYRELKRNDEALADITAIIRYEPENAESYYNRGQIYQEQGHLEECLADYTSAIHLEPTNHRILHDRGLIFLHLDQMEKALSDFDSAVGCIPSNAAINDQRGIIFRSRAYALCNLERWNDALADFNRAIEFDSKNHQLYRDRGHLYDKLENFEKAIEDYSQAIRLEPRFIDYYFQRGNLYCKVDRYEEAINDFNYTLHFHPINPKSHLYLGMLFFNRRLLQEALFYVEMAAKFGISQEGLFLVKIIKQQLNLPSEQQLTQAELALEAFGGTSSLKEMKQCVQQFPFMLHPGFLIMLEQNLSQDKIPPQYRADIEHRFACLKQIASEQKIKEENQ